MNSRHDLNNTFNNSTHYKLIFRTAILVSCLAIGTLVAQAQSKKIDPPSDYKDPCYATNECYSVPVGSEQVDTVLLKPYHAIWTQHNPENGKMVKSPGSFEEILSLTKNGQWLHVQKTRMRNGMVKIETSILDRATWQYLSLTITYENGPDNIPAQVFYDLTKDDYTAKVTLKDGSVKSGKTRTKSLAMFNGQIGGLAMATLPLKERYVATLPMIIPNLGIFWIEATVIAKKTIPTADGASQEVWEVNANWLNLNVGEVYEPGRDGDGGVYYIAVNPGNGVPPVIEYVNDGAVIAWDGVRRK